MLALIKFTRVVATANQSITIQMYCKRQFLKNYSWLKTRIIAARIDVSIIKKPFFVFGLKEIKLLVIFIFCFHLSFEGKKLILAELK